MEEIAASHKAALQSKRDELDEHIRQHGSILQEHDHHAAQVAHHKAALEQQEQKIKAVRLEIEMKEQNWAEIEQAYVEFLAQVTVKQQNGAGGKLGGLPASLPHMSKNRSLSEQSNASPGASESSSSSTIASSRNNFDHYHTPAGGDSDSKQTQTYTAPAVSDSSSEYVSAQPSNSDRTLSAGEEVKQTVQLASEQACETQQEAKGVKHNAFSDEAISQSTFRTGRNTKITPNGLAKKGPTGRPRQKWLEQQRVDRVLQQIASPDRAENNKIGSKRETDATSSDTTSDHITPHASKKSKLNARGEVHTLQTDQHTHCEHSAVLDSAEDETASEHTGSEEYSSILSSFKPRKSPIGSKHSQKQPLTPCDGNSTTSTHGRPVRKRKRTERATAGWDHGGVSHVEFEEEIRVG